MQWERMSIDEFATCQRSDGMKVVKIDGLWWVEIRPFFFRPLLPLEEIKPWSKRYPLKAFVGGILHAVPTGVPANTKMNFFIYDDLQYYSLDVLSNKRRRIIQQGIDNFEIRVFEDPAEFIATAYPIYLSFYKRTKYWYKDERADKKVFAKWGRKLFENAKIMKIGAFHENRLAAVEVSYFVENVIIGDTLFSDDDGKRMKVTDFILHKMREAATGTDADYIYLGLPSGVSSLDESKLIRGCKLLTKPAFSKINPVTETVAKVFMRRSYQRLQRVTAPDLQMLPKKKNAPAAPL